MPPLPYLLLAAAPMLLAVGYEAEIAAWRAEREATLKSDTGWLTVAGLFWLKEGKNTFGSTSTNDIVLPGGPAHAGVFEMHGGTVRAALAGQPSHALKPDSEALDDVVRIHDLTMFV